MHPKPRLTTGLLRSIKAPTSGCIEYWDAKIHDLSLRVYASGRATWSIRYRPRSAKAYRRFTIGLYPAISLYDARQLAEQYRGRVSIGEDPQQDRKDIHSAITIRELADQYLNEFARPKKKKSTYQLYKLYVEKHIIPQIGSLTVTKITPQVIDRLHRELGRERPATANRVLACVSGMFCFGLRAKVPHLSSNPAKGIEKFRETPRQRFLSKDELARLGAALTEAETVGLPWPKNAMPKKHGRRLENRRSIVCPYAVGAIKLLLLTGCRVGEILKLRWREVDFDRGLLLLPDSKSGQKVVTLSDAAIRVLKTLERTGVYVIPGKRLNEPRADLDRPWNLICARAQLEDFHIHDLRHSFASLGAGAGVGLYILGKLLGHRNPQTTERYAHLGATPLRHAVNSISDQMVGMLQISYTGAASGAKQADELAEG